MNLGYRRRGEPSGNLAPGELKRIRNACLVIILTSFVIIGFQLFNLQIIKGERYRSLSEENYLRITPIPAPRGEIFDRKGKAVVTSRPAFTVFYWYLDKEKANETLPRLSSILGIELSEVEAKVQQYSGRYFEPIPIAKDISAEVYTKIVEMCIRDRDDTG